MRESRRDRHGRRHRLYARIGMFFRQCAIEPADNFHHLSWKAFHVVEGVRIHRGLVEHAQPDSHGLIRLRRGQSRAARRA